jgi:hypothetical protein
MKKCCIVLLFIALLLQHREQMFASDRSFHSKKSYVHAHAFEEKRNAGVLSHGKQTIDTRIDHEFADDFRQLLVKDVDSFRMQIYDLERGDKLIQDQVSKVQMNIYDVSNSDDENDFKSAYSKEESSSIYSSGDGWDDSSSISSQQHDCDEVGGLLSLSQLRDYNNSEKRAHNLRYQNVDEDL